MTAEAVGRRARYVLLTDGPCGPASGRAGWRLDAANNRPLGRGVSAHGTVDDCRRWLVGLRASANVLAQAVTFDVISGLWTWRVTRDEGVCAVSVRTYQRRFECRRAVSHFLDALVDADPQDGVVRIVRADALDRYSTADPAAVTAVAS